MKRPVKTLTLLLLAALICALLSGCALTSVGVDFKEDGSVEEILGEEKADSEAPEAGSDAAEKSAETAEDSKETPEE